MKSRYPVMGAIMVLAVLLPTLVLGACATRVSDDSSIPTITPRKYVMPTGPDARVIIAGFDAADSVKEQANLVTDGTHDDRDINAFLAELRSSAGMGGIQTTFIGGFRFRAPVDLGGFSNSVFEMKGGYVTYEYGNEEVVTRDIGEDDVVISVNNASNLQVGMDIWIYDDAEYDVKATHRIITSLDTEANTVTIDAPSSHAFTVGKNARIVNAFPFFGWSSDTVNVEVRGFNFDGNSEALSPSKAPYRIPMLSTAYLTDYEIHHSNFYNSNVVGLTAELNGDVHDNSFKEVNGWDALHVSYFTGKIHHNTFTDSDNNPALPDTGSSLRYCYYNEGTEIYGNRFTGSRRAIFIDAQDNYNNHIYDNYYYVDRSVITDGKFVFRLKSSFPSSFVIENNVIIGAEYPIDVPNAMDGSIVRNNEEINTKFMSTDMMAGSKLNPEASEKRYDLFNDLVGIGGTTPVFLAPLEEITGLDVYDLLSNHNGAVESPLENYYTPPSMLGLLKSHNQDGVINFMSWGDEDAFTFGDGLTDSPFSVGFVIRAASLTDQQALLNKYDINPNFFKREWAVYVVGGKLHFMTFDESAQAQISRYSNNPVVSANSTYVIYATYDGSSQSAGLKIYVNGTRVDDADYNDGSYEAMENTSASVEFGRFAGGAAGSNHYAGQVALPQLWNAELTQAQVSEMTGAILQFVNPS